MAPGRKLDEKTLRDFIVSKQNTWFTDKPAQIEDGVFTYRSSASFDDKKYILVWADTCADAEQDAYAGQVTVSFNEDFKDSLPILAIQYNAEQFVNSTNRKAVNNVLRKALQKGLDKRDFFRGPREYNFRNFYYENEQTGDVTNFDGKESLYQHGDLVHSLEYRCRPLVKKLP